MSDTEPNRACNHIERNVYIYDISCCSRVYVPVNDKQVKQEIAEPYDSDISAMIIYSSADIHRHVGNEELSLVDLRSQQLD
jgi:hypothetical protein